jgi:molybdate transport system substrate-binding protein
MTMSERISGISSMATRAVLAELARAFEQRCGCEVLIESVGGVDAAKRVQAGEPFDVVILASDAIDRLIASGQVVGARVDLVRSPVAIAVRSGAPHPNVASEQAVRSAVLAAPRISYSTGPSGVHLARLFERWGIAQDIKQRIVQAPPGVPVGTLVARGDVELGFQQLSELLHLQGIDVLGMLPDEIQYITLFSAGVCASSRQIANVRAMLEFMTSREADEVKRRHGMEPALSRDY